MKKQTDVPVAEQKQQQQPRLKRIYKFNSFDTRQMEIVDGERVISSSFRSLIRSLLLTRLSDSNIDLINVTFEYEDDNNSNLYLRKKFTLQRQDENFFYNLDEFLISIINVNKLKTVYFGIYMTQLDSFESTVDCQTFHIPDIDSSFSEPERSFVVFSYLIDFIIKNI